MGRNPASETLGTLDGAPSAASGKTPGDDRSFSERGRDPIETSTGSPRKRSDAYEDTGSPLPLRRLFRYSCIRPFPFRRSRLAPFRFNFRPRIHPSAKIARSCRRLSAPGEIMII